MSIFDYKFGIHIFNKIVLNSSLFLNFLNFIIIIKNFIVLIFTVQRPRVKILYLKYNISIAKI